MKLKPGFVLHSVGDEHMVVATGEAAKTFNGLIRNNETANVIFELLLKEITEEEIIQTLCDRYDAPREVIEADVHRMLKEISAAGFLDE